MIWQDHWVNLDSIDQIRVIANDPGQLGLSDLLQLLWREGRRLIRKLIPETISPPQVAHLGGNDTRKGGSQHRSRQGLFRHTTRPQVNVSRMPGRD